MIEITINNQNQKIAEQTSIAGLLSDLNQPENGIAIAINNNVIPKAEWQNFQLKSKDQLLIIKATQGG